MNFELSTCVLSSRDEDGFVACQPEPYGGKGALPSYEAFQPFGLGGRPKDRADGIGANALVMRMGPDGRVLLGHDPRWVGELPDFGDGGAYLYATTEQSGSKRTPYVAVFGEAGAASEGLFRINIPTAVGVSKVEIDPSSGDITLTHAGGTTLTVKAASVELGAATGGVPLVKEPQMIAAWSALQAVITSLGKTLAPLTGTGTTKVNGT